MKRDEAPSKRSLSSSDDDDNATMMSTKDDDATRRRVNRDEHQNGRLDSGCVDDVHSAVS